MEELLTDDYFQGQADIDLYFVEPKKKDILPSKTIEQQEREDREFNELLESLINKLFDNKTTIELDICKILSR